MHEPEEDSCRDTIIAVAHTFLPSWLSMASILALIFGLRILWLLAGFLMLFRFRRSLTRIDPTIPSISISEEKTGIAARYSLSDRIKGPVTFGIRDPIIVLPDHFMHLSEPVQRAIVCHELIHVRRRDWMWTVTEEIVSAIFCFHPGIWWLIAKIRLSREQMVDSEVIRINGSKEQYVEALLEVASFNGGQRFAPVIRFIRRRHLLNRVRAIVKETQMSRRYYVFALVASATAVTFFARLGFGYFPLQSPSVAQSIEAIQIQQGSDNLLHRARLEYPRQAVEAGVEGDVSIEVTIDNDGKVSDAHVVSGPLQLRRSALHSVLEWRYDPAKRPAGIDQVKIHFAIPKGEGARGYVLRGDGDPKREVLAEAELKQALEDNGQILQELRIVGDKERAAAYDSAAKLRAESVRKDHDLSLQEKDVIREKKEELKALLESEDQIETQRRLKEVEQQLDLIGDDDEPLIEGRLKRIQIEGLSEAQRLAIQQSMPVHIGDKVDRKVLAEITRALTKQAKDLKLKFDIDEKNNVDLQIDKGENAVP